MKKLGLAVTLALLSVSFLNVSAIAQIDFSGEWKLNKSESKVSEQFSMAPETIKITQEGNNIHIVRLLNMQGQPFPVEEKFTLDGKECKNNGFQGSTKTSTVNWSDDKKSLVVKTKIQGDFGTMDSKQVYSITEGKLKVESEFSSNQGDMNETWVLAKQ